MSKAKTVDLTSGPILKTLAELALPIMIFFHAGNSIQYYGYGMDRTAWCKGGCRRGSQAECMSGSPRDLHPCQEWADR